MHDEPLPEMTMAVEEQDDDAQDEQTVASLLLTTSVPPPSPPPSLPPFQPALSPVVDTSIDSVMLNASTTDADLPRGAPTRDATVNSTSEDGATGDIEHILATGANEPEQEGPSQAELDVVVKDLRARARGIAGEKGELVQVEHELSAFGVERPLEHASNLDTPDPPLSVLAPTPAIDTAGSAEPALASKVEINHDPASDSDTSSASSSSSSSSSSGVSIALRQRAAATSPQEQRRVRGKRGKKPRGAAGDSDLSDDDVNALAAPTTVHEVAAPEPALPAIERLADDVAVVPFGKVDSVVGPVVVVKADTAGDYRVLDEGTVVCFEDKVVAGVIFETFGAVQQPYYALRFPASKPPSPEQFKIHRAMFYAPSGASFVFTRELKGLKGSDASNLYDEEVAPHEMEWSDDEAEQAYRRTLKNDRKSRSATPSVRGAHRPAQQPPRFDLGSLPPADGRRMFERNAGAPLDGDEFEFSDDGDDGEPPLPARPIPQPPRSSRGADHAQIRGRGRGRGRGAPDARGGVGVGAERRQVAPLPARPLPPSLPPRPAFEAPPFDNGGGYNPSAPSFDLFDLRAPPSASSSAGHQHEPQPYTTRHDASYSRQLPPPNHQYGRGISLEHNRLYGQHPSQAMYPPGPAFGYWNNPMAAFGQGGGFEATQFHMPFNGHQLYQNMVHPQMMTQQQQSFANPSYADGARRRDGFPHGSSSVPHDHGMHGGPPDRFEGRSGSYEQNGYNG